MKYYIGIDNGVTGSICILDEDGNCLKYFPTPVKKTLNYTKAKEYINRVVVRELAEKLQPYTKTATVVLERPLVNPGRWKATISAIRCDEATRGVIEALNAKLIYVDSKEWQTALLPKRKPISRATKGASNEEKAILKKQRAAYQTETKTLSLSVGQRLFPNVIFKKDADAALIAEWARRNNL